MKNVFCSVSAFLCAVLLASCAGGEPPAPPTAEPSISAAASQAGVEPIKGLSLEDMGYYIDYAAAPPELRERLERESGFQSVKYDDNWVDGVKGNYTKLFLYMNYLYGSDEVIVFYLQAFPNAEVSPDTLVRIAAKDYSFADLKSNLVYQDSAVSVYDIYPFLDSYASVSDVIHETVDSVNNAPDDLDDWPPDRRERPHLDVDDYNGLLELETFYRENLSKLIAPVPPETDGAINRDADFSVERPFEPSETPLEQGDLTRAADAIEKLTGRRRETEKVARFGTIIYVYAAPDLFEYDLETDRVEIVCTGEISYLSDLLPFENMEVEYDAPLLYLSPDVAFYAVGTDIYRCHIPSRTSERVYQNDRLISFEPISNNTLLITLPNPEWEGAVMETGERSNGLPEYTIFQYHIAEKRTEAYEPPFPPEK